MTRREMRYSMLTLLSGCGSSTYRSKHSVHELIQLFWSHHILALNDTHGKPRDDGQVLLKVFADDRAVPIIVFRSLDLGHSSQCLKGLIVELVDVGHVRIRDNNERQCLHVA